MLHVVDMRVHPGFRIWLRFSDGIEGIADLTEELAGPVFEPLRNPAVFASARLDPELHTIAWPNGADLAPEFLHTLVMGSRRES